RLPGCVGVDATPLPDPARRHPIDAGRAVRGRPRGRCRRMADVRGPYAAVAASHDPRGRHAPGNRGPHDVRPGVRPYPGRTRDVDAAHLHLRLSAVLPVPAGRLRRGDALHGRPRRPPRRGVRRRVDEEAGPMRRRGRGGGAADEEARPMTRDTAGERLCRLAWTAAVLAAILFAVTPLVLMVLTSLKTNREITQD